MPDDSFERLGRGGAGNFRPKKDIEAAEPLPEGLEAQQRHFSAVSSTNVYAQSLAHVYVHTGRGGAGNYVPPAQASADSRGLTHVLTEGLKHPLKLAGNANREKSGHLGLNGRGGAGNWQQASKDYERRMAEGEEKTRLKVGNQVRKDVETLVKPPPRAYVAGETFGDDIV